MANQAEHPRVHARGYESFTGRVAETSSQSIPGWEERPRAEAGSPNVIVVLVDDMGFSDLAPFGSEIGTPNASLLADDGYRFTNYHTAPVCSPARAALLTGLNPHRAGFASTSNADPGYPGHRFEIAENVPTIAESFRASGFATFMIGKWHLTPDSSMHDAADKSSWPVQRGFDRYFGSLEGFTTLFQPHRLIRDNSPVVDDEAPPDEYLTDALTDEALGMIRALRSNDAEKPFFLYFAHHAVHGPIQAKPEDMERYRGWYEEGWDRIRTERFHRQMRDGLFPPGTELPTSENGIDTGVEPWSMLSAEQRATFARYMEAYAASVDSVDQSLGRLVDYLKEIGEYENTIIVVTSDNGGSGEGGPDGTRSYFSQFVWDAGLPSDWIRDVERDPELIGGPQCMAHYPKGWAYASNTPFRYFKGQTFEGGIHAPLLVSWPQGLPRKDDDTGIRRQFAYVSDIGQTVLDLAGVPALTVRSGLPSPEVDGRSFSTVLRDTGSPETREVQYSEFFGNRALHRGDWKIVTAHAIGEPYTDAEWQLYHVAEDPTETNDVAAKHPEIVAELARIWEREAWRNTVFPLPDDETLMVVRPASELRLEQPITLYPGAPTLERYRSSKLTAMRSFEVRADVDLRAGDAGVIVAHGDQGGGYVLFVEAGRICVSYNEYGTMHRVSRELPTHEAADIRLVVTALPDVRWQFDVSVDGDPVLSLGPLAQLVSMAPFTGISAGIDRGSPVDWELFERHGSYRFHGALRSVRYLPGPKADYNPEVIAGIERETDRIYD